MIVFVFCLSHSVVSHVLSRTEAFLWFVVLDAGFVRRVRVEVMFSFSVEIMLEMVDGLELNREFGLRYHKETKVY